MILCLARSHLGTEKPLLKLINIEAYKRMGFFNDYGELCANMRSDALTPNNF